MRRGLALAAAGAAIALSTAPFLTAPARAAGLTVTTSNFALSPAPDAGHNVATNALFVDGHFHVDGGVQPTFDWITANLSWLGKGPAPQSTGPYTICGKPPSGPQGGPCSGADVDLAHHPLVPAPAYNGPYRVSASGHATDRFSGQDGDGATGNIDFNLVVPPNNVTAVAATVDNKTRNISLSWDRDTSPDLQSYFVWRKGPGDKDFTPALQVLPTSSGARVSAGFDGKTLQGGDYVFEVEARRNGATGDSNSFVASDRSKSQSNKVTVPAPPPGQTVAPTTVPKGGGPPPVVKGTPSGVNRSSGFSGSASATTPTSEAVTPDPGFVHGLPDAGGTTPGEDNSSEGDNSAVAVTPGRHTSNGRGNLVPVAGAAVLVLGAAHMRIFKKRLDEPPTHLTPVS